MPKYSYVALSPQGEVARGVAKADDRAAAELALFEQDFHDIRLTEKKSALKFELTGPGIKRDDLMHLSRQLAAFLRAGLPIVTAVQTIGAESENTSVRKVMADIEDGLRSGDRFSDTLDRHRNVFPDFYRGIVRSAELTGELETVLSRLAIYLERDLEAKRKIKSALIYPIAIAGMSVVTVVVLAAYVLPKFKTFFAGLNAKLPLPTRMLLWVTDFLTNWWWAVVGGILFVVLAVLVTLQFDEGKYLKDRLILAVPVLGTTIQYSLVERFCRVLASMVDAGVNLPEALRVATETLRNRVFVKGLAGVGEALLEGEGIAVPLGRTGLFPPTASQMLRVGEETGSLDAQLILTAQYYETELDYKLKKLISLFEPAVIVVMGLIVGFVAIALISAMYGIFRQVQV
jgi:type IV pilus assembly protein PilC